MPTATTPGLLESRSTIARIEGVGRSVGRILLERQLKTCHQHVIRPKSRIDGAHSLETSQKGARSGEQHQRDRNLRDYQG